MDYLKIYESICARGKLYRDIDYVEKHHIIPKCLGGSDASENMTTLSGREHFVVHLLLTKIYPKNNKIEHAFCMMLAINRYQIRHINSKYYDKVKTIHSKHMTINNPMKNPIIVAKVSKTKKEKYASGEIIPRIVSDNEKKLASERMKKNNPMTRFPEKNHTVKRTVVYYEDGTVKEFKMKKEFMETLVGLTHMQKRYKIDNNNLKEFGIIKVECFGKG